MMIKLPSLAPFDLDAEDLGEQLAPSSMVGVSDEIYEGGMAGWKQNPAELGAGLQAFIRELKPLADETPKISGALFLDRLRGFGFDLSGVAIAPEAAIRQDASLGDASEDHE
ncbi:hypothetical protein [uncultured Tateyamaria sp.]|uniref:hypothetical protein n=1 Tax=uncultured Tateyamaria sp. TaxID=455651 RepID=UPI00260B12FA|nr:hypothetical protein [uncultured Tateyamaria sp.]